MKKTYPSYLNLLKGIALFIVLFLFNSPKTLAQLSNEDCKFLGNIVANGIPSNFEQYWNQVTPENGGKWGSVESTRDEMSWAALDIAYNLAKDNGLLFKQHTFVWGRQQPNWIESLTAEEQKAEVEEWIKLYSERYPETDFIDVVNEPLHAMPSYITALGGGGETGYDWIIWYFEKAREYLPNAKLLINDYGILNSAANTSDYLSIIEVLQEKGLIDGIGVQAHGLEKTDISLIEDNLDRLAATDLPIYVSEYDVSRADDQEQLAIYKEQFPVFWEHPAVKGVTLWGFIQGQIWKEDAYLIRSNGTVRPALEWLEQYLSGQGKGACKAVPTGIEDLNRAGISIYPNPAQNGRFKLLLTDKITEVNILDVNGQHVKSIPLTGRAIIAVKLHVPAGLYIVQLISDSQIIFDKIAVQ